MNPNYEFENFSNGFYICYIWIRADDAYPVSEIYGLQNRSVWFFAWKGFLAIHNGFEYGSQRHRSSILVISQTVCSHSYDIRKPSHEFFARSLSRIWKGLVVFALLFLFWIAIKFVESVLETQTCPFQAKALLLQCLTQLPKYFCRFE